MLTKLALVLQSKLTIAILGTFVVAGGGTVVTVAAASGAVTLPGDPPHQVVSAKPATQSRTVHADTAGTTSTTTSATVQETTVSVDGVLVAYDSTSGTLTVRQKDGTTVSVTVNTATVVNGAHASTLADLSASLNQGVEVSAARQPDGSLLASKVTVQDSGLSATLQSVTGTVASVDVTAGTVVVTESNGTSMTVSVSGVTHFEGGVKALDGLQSGMLVNVEGTLQPDGSLAARQFRTAESSSGSEKAGSDTTATPGTDSKGTDGGDKSAGSPTPTVTKSSGDSHDSGDSGD